MAIISINGFFRIFGRLSAAPPVFFPSNFFLANSRTTWPKRTVKEYQLIQWFASNTKSMLNALKYWNCIHSYWTFIERLFKRTTQRRSWLQHG